MRHACFLGDCSSNSAGHAAPGGEPAFLLQLASNCHAPGSRIIAYDRGLCIPDADATPTCGCEACDALLGSASLRFTLSL
jgi:hypothetical protein